MSRIDDVRNHHSTRHSSQAAPPPTHDSAARRLDGSAGGSCPAATPTADHVDVEQRRPVVDKPHQGEDIDVPAVVRTDDHVQRNKEVTEGYQELSEGMNDFLNKPGTPPSGANWATYAKWASREVGDAIQGKNLPPGAELTGAQDALSAGNTKVFKDIAPDYQAFLKDLGHDKQFNQEHFDEWSKRFGTDEQGTLKKEAFESYYKAGFEQDAKKKQELTLLGNMRIAEHEQKLLDSDINKAFKPADNSGVLGTVGKIAGGLFGGPLGEIIVDKGSEYVARNLADPGLHVPDGHGGLREVKLQDDIQGQFAPNLTDIDNPALKSTLDRWNDNSTKGSGTDNWGSLDDRMRYIGNLMRVTQMDPDLFGQDPQQELNSGNNGATVASQMPRVASTQPVQVDEFARNLQSNFGFLDTAADGGKGDGRISVNDLRAAAENPNAPAQAREVAQALLRNDALRYSVDTASGGGVDGTIGGGDVDRFRSNNQGALFIPTTREQADQILRHYNGIFDTASGGGDKDGHVSQDDLRAVLNNPDLPPEIKQAARILLA